MFRILCTVTAAFLILVYFSHDTGGEPVPDGWVDSEHTHTSVHSRLPEDLRVTTTHSHPHDPNGYHTHPGETVAEIHERTLAQTDYWHSHDRYVRHSHPGSSRDSHDSLDHSSVQQQEDDPLLDLALSRVDPPDENPPLEYKTTGPHSHDGLISHTHLLPIGVSHDDVSHVHTPKIGEEVEVERSADTRQPVNTQPVNTQPVNTQPVNTQPVGTQPVGTTTPPVTETPTNNNRQPADPALEQPVGGVNTPPVVVVPTPNTGDAGEPPVQEQAPQVVEVVHPTFPLRITSVEEKQDPRRLIVTIKNDGRQFYRLQRPFSVELLQRNGRPVVVANLRQSVGNTYLLGKERETVFALLPKSLFDQADASEVNFMVHFQYFQGGKKGFLDGDRIALKYDGRLVTEYPEPLPDELVPAFPLKVLSVEEKQNPRRLMVTIKNNGRPAYSLQRPFSIELLQHDGKTVVVANMRKSKGLTYLRGGAETVIALLPKTLFDDLDDNEVNLMLHFQYFFGSKKGYLDGDRIALKHEGETISEYPEATSDEAVSTFPLTITSVEEKQDPRRLVATIKNTGRPTYALERPFSLELQRNGETVVIADMRHTAGSGHLHGGRETVFTLLPKRLFKKVDTSEVSFLMHFQYFYGDKKGYLDGDRLVLKYEDEVIAEYPDPEQVPAAPQLQRKQATLWGSLKMERR